MKTWIYFVFLVILGAAVYVVFFNRPNDNPYGREEAGFNVDDTSSIGRIFIADYNDQTILAERTDSGWMLNKKYKVLPSMLRLVMSTLHEQKVLYPVTKSAFDMAVKQLASYSTKVEIYSRSGCVISKFYVGGAAPGNSGTFMMMEGAKTPYVVHIANHSGLLSSRYSGRIEDWRDRTVFRLPANEIKEVTVTYADKPDNSFTIKKENNVFSVEGAQGSVINKDNLNVHNANLYMQYFADVNCEGYLNGKIGMDSVMRTAARHSVIDVAGVHGQQVHVEIFWMPINQRSKNRVQTDADVPDEYDSDRFYALINGNRDTVLIQRMVFRSILRKLKEFYPEVQSSN